MTAQTVLIVSPYFPPSTLAGVHRARHLAKHLPAFGWRPVVMRIDERCYTEPGDPGLAALVPADLDQIRVGALPARICRAFGVGDIGLRAIFQLRAAVERAIEAHHPQLVLITGSPFFPMLLAPWIRRRFGLPVVLDFQDPWLSAQGALRPWGTKGWLAHRLAAALEPVALRGAAFVTSVSDIQNDQMAGRHPWLDRGRMAAIPIGGDPDDFIVLRTRPAPVAWLDPAKINFSYVGTFLPRAAPLIEALFAGLGRLRGESPDLAARLRLNFIGASNQPTGVGGHRIQPYAEAAGVGDLVRETPQRIPYLDALGVLANSDVLMLIGSDEPHYTASKIYPALLSGRPFLSLFHEKSSAHQLLLRVGGGRAIPFHGDLTETASRVATALRELASTPEAVGSISPDAIAPYTGRAVATQFAEIFDNIAAVGDCA